MSRISLVCRSLVVALLASSPARAAHIQTTGHTDIRFLYDATTGTADIAYFLDQGSMVDGQSISAANPIGGTPVTVSGGQTKITYPTTNLITFVPDPSVVRPAGAAWDFTGTTAGSPLWYVGQTQDVNKPWTGISTESVTSAQFSNIRYELTAFSGPGQMSVTTTGVFGGNTVFYHTSNGLSAADAINVPAGTHAHYNWYFTQPGIYTFDLTVTGTRTAAAGGGTVSASDTFTFHVAVPEPTSLGLMAPGAALLFRRRKR